MHLRSCVARPRILSSQVVNLTWWPRKGVETVSRGSINRSRLNTLPSLFILAHQSISVPQFDKFVWPKGTSKHRDPVTRRVFGDPGRSYDTPQGPAKFHCPQVSVHTAGTTAMTLSQRRGMPYVRYDPRPPVCYSRAESVDCHRGSGCCNQVGSDLLYLSFLHYGLRSDSAPVPRFPCSPRFPARPNFFPTPSMPADPQFLFVFDTLVDAKLVLPDSTTFIC